ncbi:unnamed protein product [Mytilus edulis]|uniref:Uncharacterized protein n=1 Tax=Mytilus edulis TaxID=6550 RepID=A0A8S3VIR8_MYTED|nr:unnamed protein product [Mytilus edulis]
MPAVISMTLLRMLTVFNRVALRQIERGDHVVSKVTDTLKTKIKQGTSKSATTTEEPRYDKLVGRINQLTQKVTSFEQQNATKDIQINSTEDIRVMIEDLEEVEVNHQEVLSTDNHQEKQIKNQHQENANSSSKNVGHIVSEEGLQIDKTKDRRRNILALEDIRQFLGLVGYDRRFIHRFR